MRVAQLIETLDVGGAERLSLGIAHARASEGDESHLITITDHGALKSRVASDVVLHSLGHPYEPGSFTFGRVSRLLKGYSSLVKYLKREGVEVLQSHLPQANFWGLVLATQGVCRVFPTIHNNQEFAYGDEQNPLRYRFRKMMYRSMLTRCSGMIAVSDEVRQSMITELEPGPGLADRINVVCNGVDIPSPISEAEKALIRRRYGIPEDAQVMVSVGRLSEQKNLKCLVTALNGLKHDQLDWHCIIAGEGPLESDLKQQVLASGLEDRLLLPGYVADIEKLLQMSDVFVLPSLWEGLPLVLLEAMAAGLPVVGSRIHGLQDVIIHGEQGLLFETDNAEALANALRLLLGDREMQRAMGQAGHRLVKQQYGFSRVSCDLGTLYREALV